MGMPASHGPKGARNSKRPNNAKPVVVEIDRTEQTSLVIEVDGC
jgi:hypothetical protein